MRSASTGAGPAAGGTSTPNTATDAPGDARGRCGPAPMTADYALLTLSGSAWVAEQRGRLVGLLVLESTEDHLLLDNVTVDPDAQGVGVGSRLLRLAEEQALTRGLNEVRLYTNVAMNENLAYYPRHGYRETHRATQDGYQRVFFTKTIVSDGQP